MGTTPRDAEHQAVELFKGIVEAAIEDKQPLSAVLPGAVPFKTLPLPISEASKVFEEIEKIIDGNAVEADTAWRGIPTSPSIPVPALSY